MPMVPNTMSKKVLLLAPVAFNLAETPKSRQIIDELENAKTAYHELLTEVPGPAWEKPSGNPAWNIRQMMYHITIALRLLPQDVRFIRRGSRLKPPAWLFNWFNKWYNRWGARGHTKTSLAAAYDRNHETALALLGELSDEELLLAAEYPDIGGNMSGGRRTIADIYLYAAAHVAEHTPDVKIPDPEKVKE